MDLTSTVRTDTLPAIASVLVPGAGALAPYVAVLFVRHPAVAEFLANHEATALLAGVLVSVATGFLIESVGSYVEYYIIDRRHEDRDAMMEEFRTYIRVTWDTEPIGQHYLRRLLAVFKYELNGCTATVLALPGVAWLVCTVELGRSQALALFLTLVIFGIYMFHAATQTSFLLAELRKQLLRAKAEQLTP